MCFKAQRKTIHLKFSIDLLYKDRQLIDGWDKMMSIYPVCDWPYFQRKRTEAIGQREKARGKLLGAYFELVRKDIRQKGPVSSKDLGYDQNTDWSWAPTKISRAVLENMYHLRQIRIGILKSMLIGMSSGGSVQSVWFGTEGTGL